MVCYVVDDVWCPLSVAWYTVVCVGVGLCLLCGVGGALCVVCCVVCVRYVVWCLVCIGY